MARTTTPKEDILEGFFAQTEILSRVGHQSPLRQNTDGRFVTNIVIYTNFAQNRADGNTIEIKDRHTIVVWDRLAELCAQQVRVGTRLYAEGH